MTEEAISREVRDFIAKYIDSIAQIEALLLMRETSSEVWSLSRIAKRLYISEKEVADPMMQLRNRGLIVIAEDGYRFQCATAELDASVTRLAHAYSRQLIPVTNLIHSKTRRIQQFADAFRLRKDR